MGVRRMIWRRKERREEEMEKRGEEMVEKGGAEKRGEEIVCVGGCLCGWEERV